MVHDLIGRWAGRVRKVVEAIGAGRLEARVEVALAPLALDTRRIAAGLAGPGLQGTGDAAIAATVDRALDTLVQRGRPLAFDWLVGLLDALALQGASGFGEQLALFRKSWLSLAGVLADLGTVGHADRPLVGLGLQRFAAEWPARVFAPAESRALSTHVSTALPLPVAADTRFAVSTQRDIWRSACSALRATLEALSTPA